MDYQAKMAIVDHRFITITHQQQHQLAELIQSTYCFIYCREQKAQLEQRVPQVHLVTVDQ